MVSLIRMILNWFINILIILITQPKVAEKNNNEETQFIDFVIIIFEF